MQKKLHPVQEKLLDLLTETIDEPLSIQGMMIRLNLSSKSVVAHHIKQLEIKGYLKRNPSNPRDYQVLRKGAPEKQITLLNLYGLARCGPNGSILDGNPIERIPITTRLLTFPSKDAFMVKAKGDSMVPKISDGDLLIVKRTNTPKNGNIMVCVNNGETVVKKVQIKDKKTILVSLNQNFEPFLASDDFRVEGEVRGVIS